MDFISNINKLSSSYFHFEERKTGSDKLKIASYFFTLGLLPLLAGVTLGLTSLSSRITYKKENAPQEKVNSNINGVVQKQFSSKDVSNLSKAATSILDAEIIGPEEWIEVIGIDNMKEFDIVDAFPYPIEETLTGPSPNNSQRRFYETHRLVLIPSGLSIERIKELRDYLKSKSQENKIVKNNNTMFDNVLQAISHHMEKCQLTKTEKSEWIKVPLEKNKIINIFMTIVDAIGDFVDTED